MSVRVNGKSANLPEAEAVAEQLAISLLQVKEKIDAANPATRFQWQGHVYTASELKILFNKTNWVVSDQDFGNGGVGAAVPGTNGANNTVYLKPAEFTVNNPNGYGAVGYQGQGLLGTIFHELGHFTQPGREHNLEANTYSRMKTGKNTMKAGGEYWVSNESFTHSFSKAASSAIGFDLGIYNSKMNKSYGSYKSPFHIYDRKHNPNPAPVIEDDMLASFGSFIIIDNNSVGIYDSKINIYYYFTVDAYMAHMRDASQVEFV